jgi:hypothetical protein
MRWSSDREGVWERVLVVIVGGDYTREEAACNHEKTG